MPIRDGNPPEASKGEQTMIGSVGTTGRVGIFHSSSAKCLIASFALILTSLTEPAVAAGENEVQVAFDRFVAAQNAHDAEAVQSLLLDSPQFLWITRGTPIWGSDAAIERFTSIYEGTWRLEPDASGLQVMMIAEGAAQIFVPIDFTIGAPGERPQPVRFLMNMVLTETADGWKITSILPIPAPAP